MNRTLLVVGASGQLGRRVALQALQAGWRVVGTYNSAPRVGLDIEWQQLNIAERASVSAYIATLKPAAIVHTAVHPQLAGPGVWAVNADGAASVAAAAAQVGARLVHVSTDALFDGRDTPYTEEDTPYPVTVYGASKAAAETAISALLPTAAIVRTSLLIDDDPPDKHTAFILDIAAGRRSEALFTDEIRCPVAARDLAAALVELADVPHSGILNIVGADALSRYELGLLVARRYGIDPATVRSTTLVASGLRRPGNVELDITRARTLLATRVRGAREFLSGPAI